MDGKVLALARQEKERIHSQSIQEDRRRHEIAYGVVPELRKLDEEIAGLMKDVVAVALGETVDLEAVERKSLDLQKQRRKLLMEHNWPEDWLDGAWRCKKCQDRGYVEGQICSCLVELYEQQQAKELSALMNLGDESFETFDLTYYSDTPDPNEHVSCREYMNEVLGICIDYAENFRTNHLNNLLLYGNAGLGKTFLSACIARKVAEQGVSVAYETATDIMGAFERARFSSDEGTRKEAETQLNRFMECDLLILDDLGTELVNEFTKSSLYTLINKRIINKKKTIISTNLDLERIEKKYTPQIYSRLAGEYHDLHFVGEDIRILKKRREEGF